MWVIGHAQVGWFLARAARLERRDRALVAWCSALPDLDAITLLAGHEAYLRGHHVYLHNLLAAALLAAGACALAGRRLAVLGLGLAGALLHFASDGFGYLELRPLWPFSRYLFWPNDGRHWVAAVGEIGVPVLLLAAGAWLFGRERISVLEALSARIDPWMAEKLRARAARLVAGDDRAAPPRAPRDLARDLALELVAFVALAGTLTLVAQAVLEIVARPDWSHAALAALPGYVLVRWLLPAVVRRVLDGLARRIDEEG